MSSVAQILFDIFNTFFRPFGAVDVAGLVATPTTGGAGCEVIIDPVVGTRGGERDLVIFIRN